MVGCFQPTHVDMEKLRQKSCRVVFYVPVCVLYSVRVDEDSKRLRRARKEASQRQSCSYRSAFSASLLDDDWDLWTKDKPTPPLSCPTCCLSLVSLSVSTCSQKRNESPTNQDDQVDIDAPRRRRTDDDATASGQLGRQNTLFWRGNISWLDLRTGQPKVLSIVLSDKVDDHHLWLK